MRVPFMVGSRQGTDTRYRMLRPDPGSRPFVPFPGPWRVRAVVRGNQPRDASRPDTSRRSSKVRTAAPESTASAAFSTPARSPSTTPAT